MSSTIAVRPSATVAQAAWKQRMLFPSAFSLSAHRVPHDNRYQQGLYKSAPSPLRLACTARATIALPLLSLFLIVCFQLYPSTWIPS